MKLRLHFVVDPMGWFCISMVLFVWLYNSFFIPKLVLLPHYVEGHIPASLVVCYYLASLLCVSALFRASTADPGKLAQDPKIPLGERDNWEMCNKCNMMRPKRSHHCSRCGHCVRRMDHHCPWINNCVGEDNHWLFLQLCFYTQVLSLYTLVLDFCQYYYFQPLSSVDRAAFAVRHELALLRGSCFMGLIMFGGMSSLFYTQVKGILTDTTTIEKMSHLLEDIGPRRSWQQAMAEVFGTRWKILWLLPFRSRQPLRLNLTSRAHV
ncbi:palmitoyltransferase ZDHHC21 [Megalobrama amblycephala]|uniref:palmitoyltransferase ZDHHC21 n=1 Tax=Megalobrama amblycephala TaxID=75352 RepID=UPI002013FD0C|nr:palmitoyltransferase ZDHHC21 [Megalobrama amblycephala]XP_048041912.1 palmitoyltransferase ZDHHC21 [Megalobrama amblycephala]